MMIETLMKSMLDRAWTVLEPHVKELDQRIAHIEDVLSQVHDNQRNGRCHKCGADKGDQE